MFDIFEERPAYDVIWRNTVEDYIDVILKYRAATKNQQNECVFLLYQQPNAWERVTDVENIDFFCRIATAALLYYSSGSKGC